jgi:Methylamine utilisation protein MauE
MNGTDVAIAARVVVALILVVSSCGKLLDFRRSIAVSGDRFGGRHRVSVVVTVGLPVAELILGVLLLSVDAAWPSYLALAAFVLFTIVVVRRLVEGDRRPCNCFGAASGERSLSVGSLVRNTWFVALAVVATGAATMQEPSAFLATLVVGLGLAAVSAVLVVRT